MWAAIDAATDRCRRSRGAVLVGGITALAALTRLPGYVRPWFDRDEAEIAVEAQALLRGEHLYRDILDRKPPLVPLVFATVQRAVGPDLRPVRALLVLWVACTALVVFGIARRLDASWRAAAVGAVLTLLGAVAFVPRDGQAANFELWAALPATAAVFVALRARPRHPALRFALAGALVGVAACTKQPFATAMAPVLVAAWMSPRRLATIAASFAGLTAAFLTIGGAFGLDGMVRWVWTENGDYILGRAGVGPVVATGAAATAFVVATHLPTVWLAAVGLHRRRPVPVVVVAWLAASAVAVAAGLRFSGHYFQIAVAPLCVLAALGADALSPAARRVAILASAGIAAAAVVAAFAPPLAPTPMRIDAVLTVIERDSRPSDRILVWGSAPEIAWKSGRPIAGGFVHSGWLTSIWRDPPGRPEPVPSAIADDPRLAQRWTEYMADVQADAPVLVVDTSPRGVGRFDEYPMDSTPLGAWVARHYRRLGGYGGMVVWRRTDRL